MDWLSSGRFGEFSGPVWVLSAGSRFCVTERLDALAAAGPRTEGGASVIAEMTQSRRPFKRASPPARRRPPTGRHAVPLLKMGRVLITGKPFVQLGVWDV